MIKKQYRLKRNLKFCENCNQLIESPQIAEKGTIVDVNEVHPYNKEFVLAFGAYIPVKYLEEIKK